MPTVDFGACIANYWFVWSINGLGSIFGLAINMAVTFFFMKYFHNIKIKNPSAPDKPKSDFSNLRNTSPISNQPARSTKNDALMGNAFNT